MNSTVNQILLRLKQLDESLFVVGGELDDDKPDFDPKIGSSEFRLIERPNAYFVKADIAGFAKNEVEVSITDNNVSVKAQAKQQVDEDGGFYYSSKSINRSIRLPKDADKENAKAKLKDGILLIKFPKIRPDTSGSIKTIDTEGSEKPAEG